MRSLNGFSGKRLPIVKAGEEVGSERKGASERVRVGEVSHRKVGVIGVRVAQRANGFQFRVSGGGIGRHWPGRVDPSCWGMPMR
ncbi:hypothetical protein MPNT_30168 [Candidatus Methylacidithermus pantelleriae]|uniref:Uncharacterized protein n=1 Tax=Candidatus Methylacidithermus pantelleriae TaxID=2744239 RepID=A0A8J2BLJ1_9BACT|nr:hypothetical protein MPNT_30168 [Candidatus Methylacidithermus pantelleriae]